MIAPALNARTEQSAPPLFAVPANPSRAKLNFSRSRAPLASRSAVYNRAISDTLIDLAAAFDDTAWVRLVVLFALVAQVLILVAALAPVQS